MTQPDAAATRSLEEILASIRRSLSEETVDGIVELSAAAAAAARAEAKPANGSKSAASAPKRATPATPVSDPLSAKLAGALNSADAPLDDLADVLAEPAPQSTASPKASAPASSPAATDEAKDPLWFLRPGAPEEPSREAPKGPVPKLEIDPFSAGRPVERKQAAAAAGPVALPEEEQILTTPRLDPERLNRINTLKTPPAEEIGPDEVADAIVEPPEADPPSPSATAASAAAAAPLAASESMPTQTGILSRRDAQRVPLFGGATDKRKPIVSAPLPSFCLEPPEEEMVPSSEPAAPAPLAFAPDEPETPVSTVPVAESFETPSADPLVPDEELSAPVAASEPEATPAGTASDDEANPNRPLEVMIAAVLEPVLQKLLEKNLAPMLEAMVRREVEKALQDIGR